MYTEYLQHLKIVEERLSALESKQEDFEAFLKPPSSKAFSLSEVLNASELDLVAGTGFEPATFGL